MKRPNYSNHFRLYSFRWEYMCGGDLHGLFLAHPGEVEFFHGEEINFGEVLGKHSEVEGTFDIEDYEEVKVSQEARDSLFQTCGLTICGYDPIETAMYNLESERYELLQQTLAKYGPAPMRGDLDSLNEIRMKGDHR